MQLIAQNWNKVAITGETDTCTYRVVQDHGVFTNTSRTNNADQNHGDSRCNLEENDDLVPHPLALSHSNSVLSLAACMQVFNVPTVKRFRPSPACCVQFHWCRALQVIVLRNESGPGLVSIMCTGTQHVAIDCVVSIKLSCIQVRTTASRPVPCVWRCVQRGNTNLVFQSGKQCTSPVCPSRFVVAAVLEGCCSFTPRIGRLSHHIERIKRAMFRVLQCVARWL